LDTKESRDRWWGFLRVYYRWLATVIPVCLLGIVLHVGAWAIEDVIEGARITQIHFRPTRLIDGTISYGSISETAIKNGILHALAPTFMWILLALLGLAYHAVLGRTRFGSLDRCLFILTVALPVVAIGIEASYCFTSIGFDGETLNPFRFAYAGFALAACTLISLAGWLRFTVVFPSKLLWYDYAVAAAIIVALGAVLHASEAVRRSVGLAVSSFTQ
jgi:hypothetical protein